MLPCMGLAVAAVAQGALPSAITATNWGVSSGAATQTSPSRALTIPGGNPGRVLLTPVVLPGTPSSLEYQVNAGAWGALTVATTLTGLVSTDTLTFRLLSANDTAMVTVDDPSAGARIGDWQGITT